MANAFERAGHTVGRFDYRARRNKFKPWSLIKRELQGINEAFQPDVVLIQRAEKMPASFTKIFNVPVVFWSTGLPASLKALFGYAQCRSHGK